MSVEIKNGWVNGLESIPSDYPVLQGEDKAYIVHIAPIYRGRPNMDEEHYSVSYWDFDRKCWGDIYEDNIVLHWMPFTKLQKEM